MIQTHLLSAGASLCINIPCNSSRKPGSDLGGWRMCTRITEHLRGKDVAKVT